MKRAAEFREGRQAAAPSLTPSSPGLPASGEQPALRRATAEDVARLAGVLAAAFVDDPAFTWMLPDDGKRPVQLRRYFELELRHVGLARGAVWTTAGLAGAALSTPPGKWKLPWRTQVRQGLAFTRAFGLRLPRAAALLARMEARHPRRPHYYFPYIGVAPEGQGQGLGTRLMTPTLETCDGEAVFAYLEASSERNAALYERLGFELIDELEYGGRQPLRLMRRPAGRHGRA